MSGHLAEHLDGVSPPNGWTVRTDESMAGTIPTVLDQPQTDELGDIFACGRIRSQHVVQCHHENVPLSLTHGIRPTCHLGDNKVAVTPDHHAPRTDDRGTTSGVRCTSNSRSLVGTTSTPSTIPEGRTSVAGRTEYSHVTPHRKVSPETIRTLSHHQSVGTSHIPTPTSRTVDHPPRVSCGSSHAL